MDTMITRRWKMCWLHQTVFVSITCLLTAVLANSHRHQDTQSSSTQVPLMLSGTYATSKVLRSYNETTVYIAAFGQDFVLDVQKSRNYSVLQSTVETIYRALDKPFRRKTTLSDGCFFHGNIRGRRKSFVFLDASSGSICGTIYDGNYTYIITEATKESPVLHRFTRLTSVERPRHERRQDPPGKFWKRWRRQVRQITQPSAIQLENKYLELYIVHDHQQFLDSNRNSETLRNMSSTLTHLLAKVFQDVNITISLVGSEVWNEGDEITVSSDVYTTLDNFLTWREEVLLPQQSHDFALLISGTTFMHHMKAHTYHGEMCSQSHSAAILEDYTDDIVQIASDAAHSIGHNIGLMHDSQDCSCDDDTGYCVMDVVKRKQPPTKFSSCSKRLIANHYRVGRLDCLNDLPAIPRGPLCGNGLLEEGEECDCGKPQECEDVCCLSSECLRRRDCSRRSSQILAAAEVVTAPLDPPDTEERDTSPLTDGINYPLEDQAINTRGRLVDETVEERFNTINANGVVASVVPQPGPTEPAKLTSPQIVGTTMTEAAEEVFDAEGEDLDDGVIATREALTEAVVSRNITGDVDGEHEGFVAIAADVEATYDLDINNNTPTSETSIPDENSVETSCDVVLTSDGSQDILGDRASVAQIMEELGQSELPEPPAFIVEPEPELYIVRAKDLQLHCEASGSSVIGYTWLKDGEELDIQSDPRMILNHGNLTIQFPDSGDIGIYRCLVSNIYTTIVSSESSVRRAFMGSFSPGPGTIREVTVGISVILACNPPLSVPNPLVMWALNTSAEPINYSRRVSQDPKGNLIIASVEEQDTGLYYCIVVNEIMERRIESPRINLIIRKPAQPPEMVYYPETTKVGLEGEQLSLKCLAVGSPVPQIWWEKEDAELPHNRSSHTSFGQELIISSLKLEDAGLYRCIADNGAGVRAESSVTLTVKASPYWESEPVSLTVPVGSPASFICVARGDPTPAITWLINNQPADEVSEALKLDLVAEPGHGTLRVNKTVDVDSSSAVQCVASNRYGTIISNAHLTVLALAPVFRENAPSEVLVLEGDTVHLQCQGVGAPSPTVSWWNGLGDKVANEGRFRMRADGSLVICDIKMTDERDYKCKIENKFGYETSKTQLFIRRRTQMTNPPTDTRIPAGDQLFLPCAVTSDPAHHISFTWMTPRGLQVSVGSGGDGSLRIETVSDEDQGLYTCTAKSALDSVSASALVVVEERSIPLLCGNGIVDEEEECDGGLYNASNPHPCCTKHCQWRSDLLCREDTQCCKDCELLESGVQCHLEVEHPECYQESYCNGLDIECPPDLEYIQNGMPCRNNGQCLDGECIPFCDLRAGLESCDCPSDSNTCVHCCVQDGICLPFLSQEDNSTVPRPDNNGMTCGRNGVCNRGKCVGEDPTPRPPTTTTPAPTITTPARTTVPTTTETTTTTTTTQATTVGDRLPNPPSEVTMTSLSSPLDVQLSWSMEGDDDRISQFDVEAQTAYSRGDWTLLASVPSNETQARVNLAPYMTYRFRVTAVNGVGRSEPKMTSGQYFTPPDRPISNPKNISFSVENGQVVVHWKPLRPEEHGAPVFSYKVLWRPLETDTWQEAAIQMFQYTFTIPSSQEEGQYEVGVQAVNAVGPGPEPEIFTYGSVKTTKASLTTTSPYLGFIQRPPEEMQVLVGSPLTLPCQAEGFPQPRIQWFFNSRRVVQTDQVEVDNDVQLVIDPVDLSNTGMYQCRISNDVTGEDQTATSYVAVVAPMLVFTATPPALVDVLIGESIVLPCQAGGFPQATLTWRFQNNVIDYGVDIYMAENNSIIIPVADESHSGLYQCIISNGLHNVKTANSQVNIREPLEVSVEPMGILTILGSEITLPCTVTHDHPLLRVYWTRNDEVIYEHYINQTLQDYSLLIETVVWSDRGQYRCIAETALDSDSDLVQVVIQTLPDTPSNIKTNTSQDGSEVTVFFDAPFDGNSPISSYIIEYSSPEAEVPWQDVKTIAPGNTTQVATTVTIPPFWGYYVRAKAENEFGMSEPSEASDPIYVRPTAPTRNPSGVMTEVLDGGSKINVTWEPLRKSEWNGPGFYYIIDLRGANQRFGSMVTVDYFRPPNILLDVDPSLMPYEIMIQAGNDIGLGPIPEIVAAGIEEMGLALPDAPTSVMVEMITPTSINVSWTPVPQRPSYGNVYGYRVVVQASEAVFGARPESCLSTTSNCEIAGLQRGNTYRVTVIANGEGGEGFSSMPVTITVPKDLPSAVRKMKVRTWARTMLIKWEPPEIGEIQGYVIIYQSTTSDAMTVEERLDNPIENSLKIGGLTPGSAYHVTIAAFNEGGRGEPMSMDINTKPSKSKRSHHQ
eukprot:XP_003724086.2 PREDICTED: uncharacterized protein LOC100889062 isoform X1 [Strongylocentrotus purpuratus]